MIKLEQNYRSTQNILDAANGVIRNNTGRKDKTLWTDNRRGRRSHFRQFDNGYDEAEYIVGDIRQSGGTGGLQHTVTVRFSTGPTPSPDFLRRSLSSCKHSLQDW